ncbi:MAG: hypothetical protein K6L76_09790 [Agarilytica sp.]
MMFVALRNKTRIKRRGESLSKHLLLGALLSVCSQFALADNAFFLEGYEEYGIESNDFKKMRILPTRLMDNETLFLAAAAERDSSMGMSQRLLNNRWLLDEKTHSYSGAAAIRRYLRKSIMTTYKASRSKGIKSLRDNLLPQKHELGYSQFADLSNYHFKLSDDNFRVQFRYRFN